MGGRSNLTFEITDGVSTWIVRRPPLGQGTGTAHDMAREYRVMAALQGTSVPVPETFALCESVDVIGAPFYVMARVGGTPYRRAAQLEPFGADVTRAISAELVDTLVALHEVDPASVGLGDFGRSQGFLERQVRRWHRQLGASYEGDLPAADELLARLAARVPPDRAPAIVHGDYRLDNVLIDERHRAAAILDWEMATLGDPLTDLALLVVYQQLGEMFGGEAVADASSAPGFLTGREMVHRYAEGSGRDPSPLGFHLGLAAFKVAAIIQGINVRHLQGRTVGPGFDQFTGMVEPLLEVGLTALDEHH
ncbi:phosphotransferase family protein [Amycolatopsis orientalis]|uniref:phosphotransferase family protein n=1 Tax=Amycolatopsis orientalis TaxID=31958 RepID=UPI001F4402E0|nr:phosphotransferase family protein [Amycolatopsis orientalis]